MKYLLAFLFTFPLTAASQKSELFRLNSMVNKEWIWLDSNWKFKTGDNPGWAKANLEDASWQTINTNHDLLDLPGMSKKGGIAWFRLRLTMDSTLNQQLVMRIFQTGASEVYLDGKMIHQLGV